MCDETYMMKFALINSFLSDYLKLSSRGMTFIFNLGVGSALKGFVSYLTGKYENDQHYLRK